METIDRGYGVFVDTGINTGVAVGDLNGLDVVHHCVLRAPVKSEDKLDQMIKRFSAALDEIRCRFSVEFVKIEGTEMWSGSLTSQTSAASGDLFKLAYMAGAYYTICAFACIRAQIIPAQAWKGQLPKAAVHDRIHRRLGLRYPEHTADAVGMYLSHMGVL